MSPNPIYLDTNLWNRLVDRTIDPRQLVKDLESGNSAIAVSQQSLHELAKTFLNNPARGQQLFQHMKQYFDAGIRVAADVMEQLHLEVDALNTTSSVNAFYGETERNVLREAIDRLAAGHFDVEARSRVEAGVRFAKSARSGQNLHFDEKLEVKDRLRQIASAQLEGWLRAEVLSDRGTALLVRQLLRMYVEGLDDPTAARLAHLLLRAPLGIAARGLVTAELYSNWRCAYRNSLRSDVIDDMYHVLNAGYCTVYATAEAGQAEYAALLLSSRTRVAIYDDRSPLDNWLLTLP